ncbi:MAG: carbohydrate binding domain-containing protein [Paenibacillaceae bacterium]|nr:carbohydrate binding domain-containing protein [Paenibacillaceae bacterium]
MSTSSLRLLFAFSLALVAGVFAYGYAAEAATYHVAVTGDDGNDGTSGTPFRTINHAAQLAQPGDTVIVHAGTYRETVKPARGGTSDGDRITYRAASGETVYIKGSEQVPAAAWKHDTGNVYYAVLDAAAFGDYNPFTVPLSKPVSTMATTKDNSTLRTLGEVFANGTPLNEVDAIKNVYSTGNSWKASADGLTVFANFGGANPITSGMLTEINAREQIFAPDVYGLGFITVDGFRFEHAANQFPYKFWDVNGNPQKGAISTSGGHNWIIRNNTVRYAKSIGIDFGYQGGKPVEDAGYTAANFYEMTGGVGRHLIENNVVSYSGSTGIMGMWGPFSTIIGNVVENSNRFQFEQGYESAGIKTHFFFDGLIQDNLIRNNGKMAGVWLDNTSQGARVTGNVFVKNSNAIYTEISQGPILIDNNVMIDSPMEHSSSEGVTVVHNMFYTSSSIAHLVDYTDASNRITSAFVPHTIDNTGRKIDPVAHIRYYNNILIGKGNEIPAETTRVRGNDSDVNALYDGATATSGYEGRSHASTQATLFSYVSDNSGTGGTAKVTAQFTVDRTPWTLPTSRLTPEALGPAPYSGGMFGDVALDYFGNAIGAKPVVGPFATLAAGANSLTLWPKTTRSPLTADVPPYAAVNDNHDDIAYTGAWVYSSDSWYAAARETGDFGGDVHTALDNGASAEYTFTGEAVDYVTELGPDSGGVDVYIDGAFDRSLSLTQPSRLVQQTVYTKTFSGSGTHTIKLVKTSGVRVLLDAFRVHASAPAPALNADPLPSMEIGRYYRYQLQASGGTAPYTYGVASGSLPTGLALDGATGVISGVPTAPGSLTLTLQATDSASVPAAATAAFTPTLRQMITVASPDFESGTLIGWTAKGSATIARDNTTAHGGSYSLKTTRSAVFDRPVQDIVMVPGVTYDFALWMRTDSGSAFGQLVLDFGAGLQGEPTRYGVLDGQNVGTGWIELRGSYKLSGNAPSVTASFYPQLTSGTTAFYIDDVNEPAVPVVLAGTTLSGGSLGAAYSYTFAASGGAGSPYQYELASGALPSGLALGAKTGTLSGIPRGAGSYGFDIRATDRNGVTATGSYALTVSSPIVNGGLESGTTTGWTAQTGAILSVVSTGVSEGVYALQVDRPSGAAYTFARPQQTITMSKNVSYDFSVMLKSPGSAQTGQLVLDFGAGTHQGEPNRYAVLDFRTVDGTWTQLAGSYKLSGAQATATVNVYPQFPTGSGDTYFMDAFTAAVKPLVLNAPTLPGGVGGTAYAAQTFTAGGGVAPYTYRVSDGRLPSGMTLSGGGVLSGTPKEFGAFPIAVAVADAGGQMAERGLLLQIDPLIANGTLKDGTTAGWTAAAGATLSATTSVFRSDEYSLQVDRQVGQTFGRPTQTITLKAGIGYTFSAWVRTASGSETAQLVLDFGSGAHQGEPAQYAVLDTKSVTSGEWTQLFGTYTLLGAGATAAPDFYPQLTTGTGTYYVDDATNIKPLTVTSAAAPAATKGVALTAGDFTFAAAGGVGSTTFSADTTGDFMLPPGLYINASGQLLGTAMRSGTYRFPITAKDSTAADSLYPTGRTAIKWFDMTVAPMANQLANGDFESGATTGWTALNGATLSVTGSQYHMGSYGLQVVRANVGSTAGQTVSLTATRYYDVSAWVKLDSGTSDAKLVLDFGGGNVAVLDAKTVGTDWVKLTGLYKNTAASTPQVYVLFTSGTGTFYLDDVTVN